MALRQFRVGPLRGLAYAEASDLGNIVVFAGPNGAGKSTLLDLLRIHRASLPEPGTQVMFLGPHRTWRSSQVNRLSAYGYNMGSYGELLATDAMPSFQYPIPGMQWVQGLQRQSIGADDSQTFVKTTLVRLRYRQEALVTDAWQEQGGRVDPDSVPQLFEPFARLVGTLLPHLEWMGVRELDQNNIRCLFRARGEAGPEFDIDELSSGEKAAIALLLPLVEKQVERLVTPVVLSPGIVPLTMLLGEPEIHLHPSLQLQLLDYFRQLAAEDVAQFIFSTQSTTLLDSLTDDELYLVSPAALAPDNQLSRLTNSYERLEVARSLTGSTHLLTRAKPIVFVEGEPERPGRSSDVQLIRLLLPQARSWALVPGRSKREVHRSVEQLRRDGLFLPGAPVFGLVDADRDDDFGDDHVVSWPVTMVENLLLDEEAIYETLRPYGALTRAQSPVDVRQALDAIIMARIEDEVRLRVQCQIPVGRFELDPNSFETASATAKAQAADWTERVQSLNIPQLVAEARALVQGIIVNGTQLDRFHGKRVIQALYGSLEVTKAGLSRPAFVLGLAARCSASSRVQRLALPALERIRLFFPEGLAAAFRSFAENSEAEVLARECDRHRSGWASGSPVLQGRSELRERSFAVARTAPSDLRERLVSLASEIGTP